MGSWQLAVGSWEEKTRLTTNYELRTTGSTPSNRGFTLIEVIVAIGLVTFLMGLLLMVSLDAGAASAIEDARAEILDETGRGIDELTRHIQTATRVATSYTDPGTGAVTTSSTTSLMLELAADDAQGTRLVGTYDTILASREAGAPNIFVIEIVPGSGSARRAERRRVAQHVTNLEFRYFTPDDSDGDLDDELLTDPATFATATRVEATLTSQSVVEDRTVEATLLGGGTLRNRLIGS